MMPLVSTTSILAWRIDGAMVDMPAGTQLDATPMRPEELSGWENRIGCVAADWMGRRRFIPASSLEALDPDGARLLRAARKAREGHEERERRKAEKDGGR